MGYLSGQPTDPLQPRGQPSTPPSHRSPVWEEQEPGHTSSSWKGHTRERTWPTGSTGQAGTRSHLPGPLRAAAKRNSKPMGDPEISGEYTQGAAQRRGPAWQESQTGARVPGDPTVTRGHGPRQQWSGAPQRSAGRTARQGMARQDNTYPHFTLKETEPQQGPLAPRVLLRKGQRGPRHRVLFLRKGRSSTAGPAATRLRETDPGLST
ncbi:uncharacterized protein LOC124503082 isoform X1 [Lynx rufus]|uniref:uncharacterized protein LOC124503082 isoform X1 n=1 Tax=Lynx rufus TaxID=61384 RepID=UPI001F12608F|nr:uncharacterized protein LOC124503082 isoform X1 [Lynx rufus]